MNIPHHVAGHTLILLRNGEDYFPRLIEAIDKASSFVYLESYIFAADEAGRSVTDALKRAASRGVRVHLLLDGYGSLELPVAWEQELVQAGILVLWFRRQLGWLSLQRSQLRRLHRKLVVIDDMQAFLGGVNIVKDHPDGIPSPRLDYMVLVEGVIVRRIHLAMQRLWKLVAWINLRQRGSHEKIRLPARQPDAAVQFLMRDNFRHRRDIEHAYLQAIESAQQEILIANAYFLPGRRFRKALLERARAGVRVILLLQGRVEYRLQHYATLALYDELLKSGIEIHEYLASYLHAKVAVIDGKWSTVGSSNIDPFSLWLAREANIVVRDAGFAADLREDLMQQIAQHARRIVSPDWRKWNVFSWAGSKCSYLLMRLLTGLIGRERGRDDI